MVRTVIAGTVLAVLGVLATGPALGRLGHARATAKWHPERGNRLGRGVLTLVVCGGVVLVAVGFGLLVTPLPSLLHFDTARVRPPVVGIVVGALCWLVGMYLSAKIADRVELGALIRGPGPADGAAAGPTGRQGQRPARGDLGAALRDSDPDVPPTAEPGMVYRDAGGTWYLVVSAGTGFRLVALPGFLLTPPGTVRPPITPAGSVELSVYPLAAAGTAAGADATTSHPAGRP